MKLLGSIVRGVVRYIARANAERLWMHYSIAIFIVFALLFSTHLVNRSIIDRSAIATKTINTISNQVLLGHDIIDFAEAALLENDRYFEVLGDAVEAFEQAHAQIITAEIWSEDLQILYFDADIPLNGRINAFADMAAELPGGSPGVQRTTLNRLKGQYLYDGLRENLLHASDLLQARARTEVDRLSNLQQTLIQASVLLLIVEIFVIFLPAQLIVRSNIRQLRKQGDVLRRSEAKLQDANGQLEHLINHDALTGLPNRAALLSYINKALNDQNTPDLAVLFIGLDGFKSINDTAGHDFGDEVLIAVATTLKSCVDDDHIVARVGGDEFVVITDEAVEVILERVRASLAEPLEIRGRRMPVEMSIGHLELSVGESEPLAVMADAGLALQVAKNLGGGRAQKFHSQLRDEIGSFKELQLELIDAIKNGEIEPWFQPQIRLSDGQLHGAEVLARWRHPKRGLLTPDRFLPAAEQSGLMVDMDHSIWKSAMKYARGWELAQLWRPCISLNAAPATISDPYMIERFLFELQKSGLAADQVVVEVLETTLIEGKDDMAAINIDSLAECGIALELDDFGTGYASLSKLTQLPLSGIKLDRSLVAPLPDHSADSVVRAILALTTELGLHVVAEGVEEDAQARHLSSRGCAFGQGYGYAKPMPPDEFATWLQRHAGRTVLAG